VINFDSGSFVRLLRSSHESHRGGLLQSARLPTKEFGEECDKTMYRSVMRIPPHHKVNHMR